MIAESKTGHARIILWPLAAIKTPPENDQLYKPVDPNDPDVQALTQSIRELGVLEPLRISLDQFAISGNRRRVAAELAGLSMVPVIVEQIVREHDIDAFVRLLREHNRQRNKSNAEKLRAPLRHASKPASRYRNDQRGYKDLCDLATRARVDGVIDMEAIDDDTRPVTIWKVHNESQSFLREQLQEMFCGYSRDLLQSQPNHVEVLVEKNTVAPICRSICMKYCLPMTSGRGYCSIPPRRDMNRRFRESGKERLVVLIVSDFDPEGENIAETFARSMRDDFGVESVHAVKVALTHAQAKRFKLHEDAEAKKGSSRYKQFAKKYGTSVWELEALPPATLQSLLEDAILSTLDMDAYYRESELEATDAAFLEGVRSTVASALKDINFTS